MAKIMIVTSEISTAVGDWSTGLTGQGHQVRILTSSDGVGNLRVSVPTQTYFYKWTAREFFRLLPSLTQDVPDIFHFIFHGPKQTSTQAHWMLMAFARSLQRPVVSTLFSSDMTPWRKNPFLKFSQAVSFDSKESLLRAKRSGVVRRTQKMEILLPLNNFKSGTSLPLTSNENHYWLGKFLVIAGEATPQHLDFMREALKGTHYHPVFWGPRPKLKHDLTYSTLMDLDKVLPHASGVIFCMHNFDASELLFWQSRCRSLNLPIFARRDQIENVPGFCVENRTGFIVPVRPEALRTKLVDLEAQRSGFDFSIEHQEIQRYDQVINNLSRLYAQISVSSSL